MEIKLGLAGQGPAGLTRVFHVSIGDVALQVAVRHERSEQANKRLWSMILMAGKDIVLDPRILRDLRRRLPFVPMTRDRDKLTNCGCQVFTLVESDHPDLELN